MQVDDQAIKISYWRFKLFNNGKSENHITVKAGMFNAPSGFKLIILIYVFTKISKKK
jgi:hypothetical protein